MQRDALLAAGVGRESIYEDQASAKGDDRAGLEACMGALRAGDTLVVWKLDRIGVDLSHLIGTIHNLVKNGVSLKILSGPGSTVETATSAQELISSIFAALAEFDRASTKERTVVGLRSARARGRAGGRPHKMTPEKVRRAAASMSKAETCVADLCRELGITRQTLYRYVSPDGELRAEGRKLASKKSSRPTDRLALAEDRADR